MTLTELRKKQKELERQIKYENKKLDVCGYGGSDLYYIRSLTQELEKVNLEIEEREGK